MNNQELLREIERLAKEIDEPVRIMEVCGTHTVSIFRLGIRQLLPKNVELVSGPGCPVCVTDDVYMDKAIEYANHGDTIIATFGDMLKVPGSKSSLSEAKAMGADVRVVYSPLDTIAIAKENPDKKVIFLAVGFETTAPTAAALAKSAKDMSIKNLFLLSAQKLVPPILRLLLEDNAVKVDGFLLPGHVCVITGRKPFDFVAEDYQKPAVISGFEANEILRGIFLILEMKRTGNIRVLNAYKSVVTESGNETAKNLVSEVYDTVDASWRGMGIVKKSGLRLNENFAELDIERALKIEVKPPPKKTACRCPDVLKGIITPKDCPLFSKVCSPEKPEGPCMVSVEGVCAAYYKYGRNSFEF